MSSVTEVAQARLIPAARDGRLTCFYLGQASLPARGGNNAIRPVTHLQPAAKDDRPTVLPSPSILFPPIPPASNHELPGIIKQLIVDEHFATIAHVADHVPMDGAVVLSASLDESVSERQVD